MIIKYLLDLKLKILLWILISNKTSIIYEKIYGKYFNYNAHQVALNKRATSFEVY